MKKSLFISMAAIAIFAAFSFTTYRQNTIRYTNSRQNFMADNPRDTPYLASVHIYTGPADTPYLSFTADPQVVYIQLNNLLAWLSGNFHVVICFLSKEGELLKQEDYYIDNRQ